MKYFTKFILVLVLGFIFLADSESYSALPKFKVWGMHNLGIYRQDIFSYQGPGNMRAYYPNGHYRNGVSRNSPNEIIVKDRVATEGAVPKEYFFHGWGGATASDFHNILRNNPPSITVDGVLLTPPFRGEIDPFLDSDIKIIQELTVRSLGGVLTETSRSYANQNNNSYVLWDNNFKFQLKIYDNKGNPGGFLPDQQCNSFVFRAWGWLGMERGLTTYGGRFNRRVLDWHVADYFPSALKAAGKITNPNCIRDDLPVSYAFGSDQVEYIKPRALYGDTWEGENYPLLNERAAPVGNETGDVNGEFTNYAYMGHATFHADKSGTDTSDDLAKPRYLGRQSLLKYGWYQFCPKPRWDWANQEGIQPPGWELGYADSRGEETLVAFSAQTIGPYLLNDLEDVSTILASAIGGISHDMAKYYGNEFMKWYRDGEGDFDNAKMNALIDTGLDSLVQNLDRAYWCYSRNYDIPDPPPAPDITVTAGPDRIYVKWGYPSADEFKDHDTGVDDYGEWMVYRKLGNILVDHEEDRGNYKYELVHRTTDKNETEWEDNGVIRGQSYHYYVTCVDDGSQNTNGLFPGQPLESTPYANRTLKEVKSFKSGEETTENVLIVPNPYSVGSERNVMGWTGQVDDIHFVNLPPYCTLKIYTATGDLIKTIEHTSGSGDETWSDMRTDWNQQPVSGVYILTVDDAKDINNIPLPTKFYKFVIVR